MRLEGNECEGKDWSVLFLLFNVFIDKFDLYMKLTIEQLSLNSKRYNIPEFY